MKKLILILFLLGGLSTSSFAQGRHKAKRNSSETEKKSKPRKQMSHFEKQPKDKKIADNGTGYKRSSEYKVDGDGFKSVNGIKKNKKFVSSAATKRKSYKKQLGQTVYAGNNQGRSLRKQMLFGR